MENKIIKSTITALVHIIIIWIISIVLIWAMVSLVTYHYPNCFDNIEILNYKAILLMVYSLCASYATSHYYFLVYNYFKK